MNRPTPAHVLAKVLAVHYRSLPMYLGYARPAWHGGDGREQETLALIVSDQLRIIDRLGEMIMELGGELQYGEFPMVFTAYHDLSFDFLLARLIEHQQRDIAQIQACVPYLQSQPAARVLVEEALGLAKGHLENLRDLQRSTSEVPS